VYFIYKDSVWADITVASAKRAGAEARDSGATDDSLFAAPLGASFEEFKPGRAESGADFRLLMPLLCILAPFYHCGPPCSGSAAVDAASLFIGRVEALL
jgi:hypothetical protein